MIENIKNDLKEKLNKQVKVYVNEGRSKTTCYYGILRQLYSNIFLIETDNQNNCYSYSDILTKKIILK